MQEEANLALVRSVFDAWTAGDYTDVSWADPAIEFVIQGPAAGTYHGIRAMTRVFRDWLTAFEEFSVEAIAFEAHGDAVFTEARFHGRGKASGMPLEALRGANVFVIRDGRVVRLELHLDVELARRRALEYG